MLQCEMNVECDTKDFCFGLPLYDCIIDYACWIKVWRRGASACKKGDVCFVSFNCEPVSVTP